MQQETTACTARTSGRLTPGWRNAVRVLAVLVLITSAGSASGQTWRDLLEKVREGQTKGGAEVVATEDPSAALEPAPPDPMPVGAASPRDAMAMYLRYLGYPESGSPDSLDSAIRQFRQAQELPPFGGLTEQALLDHMAAEFRGREAREWIRAEADDSPEAYVAYIERHEDFAAVHLADARSRLEEIAAAEEAERQRRIEELAKIDARRRERETRRNLCHRDLKSVVVSTTNVDLTGERGIYYDHIYQYIDEYPYWKYVGGGLVGIAFERRSWPGTRTLEGSLNAEGDNHVSLRISGTGTLDGIRIPIDLADGDFGFLMVPAELAWSERRQLLEDGGRYARFQDIHKIRVLTTHFGVIVEIEDRGIRGDSYSFYEVTPRRRNPLGEALMRQSPRDRWLGIRREYWEGGDTEYERPREGNLWLRTIDAESERTVEIAGTERTQDVLCRYEYGPVAVTNNNSFRPRIESELNAWAENRIRLQYELQYEPVVEIPLGHVGDFVHTDEYGTIEIRFDDKETRTDFDRTDRAREVIQSRHGYAVHARLRLYGEDFGVVSSYNLGRAFGPAYGSQPYLAQWRPIEDRLKQRRFTLDRLGGPSGEVPLRFNCSETKCVLEAQRWYMDRVRN